MATGNVRKLIPPVITPKSETIYLYPEQLKIDPALNVRPYSTNYGSAAARDKHIEELARDIERDGQHMPLLITPDYRVICGVNRLKAFLLLDGIATVNCKSRPKIECKIDHSGGDYRRKAFAENYFHLQLSPMDVADLIKQIEKEHNWGGINSAKLIADYLGVDDCKIRSYQRLHGCPKSIQDALSTDRITMEEAILFLDRFPKAGKSEDKVITEQLNKSAERQQEERVHRIMEKHTAGKISATAATRELQAPPETRIKRRFIREVMREHDAAIPRKLHELMADLRTLDSDGMPEPGRVFIRYLCDEYVKGTGNTRHLKAKFLACFTAQSDIA